MAHSIRLTGLAIAAAFLVTAGSASATEQLVLKTDQTLLLPITAEVGTVIVGNPTFADVTVDGNRVFLHGKAYGSTNIILMDQKGEPLMDYEVTVQNGGSNDVALYKAGSRFSYVCAPDCEATFEIGDNATWFGIMSGQASTRTALATGQKNPDNNQPPQQQPQ